MDLIDIYTDYLICQNKHATAAGLSEMLDGDIAHAKGDVVKGINILTCMVRYDDFSVPIGYEIIKKDIAYCDIQTKKTHRKSSTTKNQLFRRLIEQAVKNKVLFEHILADNWFGC